MRWNLENLTEIDTLVQEAKSHRKQAALIISFKEFQTLLQTLRELLVFPRQDIRKDRRTSLFREDRRLWSEWGLLLDESGDSEADRAWRGGISRMRRDSWWHYNNCPSSEFLYSYRTSHLSIRFLKLKSVRTTRHKTIVRSKLTLIFNWRIL